MARITEEADFDLDALESLSPSFSFKLDGRTWHCRHREDVPFSIVERLFPLMGESASERTMEKMLVQIGPIMQALIVPEEVDDFMLLLQRPSSPVTIRRMTVLVQQVVTNVLSDGKRPTKPSSSSARGRRPTGHTSAARSSGRATPKRASAG